MLGIVVCIELNGMGGGDEEGKWCGFREAKNLAVLQISG